MIGMAGGPASGVPGQGLPERFGVWLGDHSDELGQAHCGRQLLGSADATPHELAAQYPIGEGLVNDARDQRRIVGIVDQQGGVADGRGDGSPARGHDGGADGHGLDGGDTEAFVLAEG